MNKSDTHFEIVTPRLQLREMNSMDAPKAFELNNDPEVVRFTGDKPFTSIADAERFIRSYDDYRRFGYGRWAVLLKESNEWIGWCGLKYHPLKDETDIGFRILRRYWNKGYATEASKACLVFGFEQLHLDCIVGRVMKENLASIRVLEKTGMKFWKDHLFHEHPGCYYIANAEDFI